MDGLRAFAILLMLQGHFIDLLLEPGFRDENNTLFSIWLYFRGITAPVFFTISGTIFTYLLIRWEGPILQNPRIRKGLQRGASLILMGYVLRLNIWELFTFSFSRDIWVVDVLHCIGLSLFSIILLYVVSGGKRILLFQILALSAGILIFLFERNYYDLSLEGWPVFLKNYIVKKNSVFTIIPWLGYALIGAYLGTVFHWLGRKKWEHSLHALAGIFILLGLWFMNKSAAGLMHLYRFTDIQLFHDVAWYNYLFQRLGDVLVVFGVFMLLESVLKRFPVFLEMGRSTLSIYNLHFVVLYGSWFGLGLDTFFYHKLTPVSAVAGAVLFIISVCTVVYFWNRRKEVLDKMRRD